MRRRLYLMRHGDVSYFGDGGRPVRPDRVTLTPAGEAQARAAGALLAGVRLDRVIVSPVPRTAQTARIVLESQEQPPRVEVWPDLREIRGARLADIPCDELEDAFLATERGPTPAAARYLRGETIASLFERVVPALGRLVGEPGWDCALLVLHSGVNRAILSLALTGDRTFLGNLEQAPGCINLIDADPGWVVRAVNVSPTDLLQAGARTTFMEDLLERYRAFRCRPGR